MSLITLEGIESLLTAGDSLTATHSAMSEGGSGGWAPNWYNPSGITGDAFYWQENDSGKSFVDTLKDAATSFFSAISTCVSGINDFLLSAGQFFSGDPGTFFDTGVNPTTGLRDDGMPLGYGCGDAKTDALVPDHFGRADLTAACRAHDLAYSTLGADKAAADAQLGANITSAITAAGYSSYTASAIGWIYQEAVGLFGNDAFNNAQAEAAQQPHP